MLELEELSAKKDLQAVVMFLLMYKITQEMYLTRNQIKICIIDEAWSLLGSGSSGEFIESGYRRARENTRIVHHCHPSRCRTTT